jgi:uncharacterized protein YlxW (UPF0749 family)
MSLLIDVMSHPVDESYADAARRKAAKAARAARAVPGATPVAERTAASGLTRQDSAAAVDGAPTMVANFEWPSRATVIAAVVLVLAGALFATAAVETQRGDAAAAADQRQLVARVQQETADTADLQKQADGLATQLTTARDDGLAAADRSGALRAQLDALDIEDGAVAVEGNGVRVVLDDAPAAQNTADDGTGVILDSDLQSAVNGLFIAGAEAVAINGERLTAETAIREAGGAILVDYRALSPPYVIEAIGPSDLGTTFQKSDTGRLFVTEHQLYGLGFTVVDHQRLTLPSAADVAVHYAKTVGSQ